MTGMAFADSLPSGVSIADTPGAGNSCGGTFSPVAGATTLGFSDGVLAAGATCELRVTVRAIEAGTLTGPEVDLTSSIATASAAEATLTVDPAAPPGFVKVFSPDTVDPGGVSTLTFRIDNAANTIDVGSLTFTDAFPDGLVVAPEPNTDNSCGGTLSAPTGGTILSLSGGDVAAGATCTLSVDVQALQVGTLTGTSGELTSDLPVATPGVAATLTVNEVPLSVSMAFEPTAIRAGGVSRLTYELSNDTALAAASVSLSDTLPADIVLADPPDAETTCAGGTLTAAAGGGDVSWSGGTLGAGATCTIAVDVTSTAAGSYPNDTESVISSLGTSAAAESTLTVDAADAPGFARVFSPDTIPQGGETEIVFTVDNGANAIAMTGMAFDDSLPPGVSVADTPGAVNGCGGTFNPVAGATRLSFADGVLAAGATCELRVTVRAIEAGTLTGPAVALTSSIATARADEAILTVGAATAPVFSKAFSPATVVVGEVSRLTYTIDNSANSIEVGSLAFTDSFPSSLAVATPNNLSLADCGSVSVATRNQFGSGRVTVSGGTVAAGGTCTISLDVLASRSGTLTSTSGELTSDLPVSTPGTSAMLTVTEAPQDPESLVFFKAFSPATVEVGEVSRLTYTIDNSANSIEVGSFAFTASFPSSLAVATPNNLSLADCGSVSVATRNQFGSGRVTVSGGTVAAGGTCTISLDVLASRSGTLTITSGELTSDLPVTTPGASATLTVTEALQDPESLVFSKAFSPATVEVDEVSRLTYTIDNSANSIEVGSLAFIDLLPTGVVVASPSNLSLADCGSATTAARNQFNRGRVEVSGGTVAAGGTCTISLDVLASRSGALTGTSGDLTSDLPVTTSGASATLTVNAAPLSVSMAFEPSTIGRGGVSRLSYELRNAAALVATSISLSDTLPAGVVLADAPSASSTCAGGTLTAAAGGQSISWLGGRVAADATCMLAVNVTSTAAGSHPNGTESVTSSLGTSTPASATLTVTETAPPLVVSMSFSPSTIGQGGVSRLTYELRNAAAFVATSISLSDTLPDDVMVADPSRASWTCSGGRLVAVAGENQISYSGGELGALADCTLSVDVTSAAVGIYRNDTERVTSSLGTSILAVATLTVEPTVALGFAKTFSPATVDLGGISRLTWTVDNSANIVDVGGLAFDDVFPNGLALAPGFFFGGDRCGGRLRILEDSMVSLSEGSVAAGQTCTLSVDVVASRGGALRSVSGALSSDLPVTTPGASATLTVRQPPLSVSMSFSPAVIAVGRVSRLRYVVRNDATVEARSGVLRDTLPTGVELSNPTNASSNCAGLLTAAPGGNMVEWGGNRRAAGSSCTLAVDVTATVAGLHRNSIETVLSSLGANAAEATLTAVPVVAPGFTKAFSPATVDPGVSSTLTFTIDNSANVIDVGSLAFTDDFPIDLFVDFAPNVNNGCGGTLTAAMGTRTVSLRGGTVAAGQTCTISVDVESTRIGRRTSRSSELTSELPVTTPGASAALTVNAAPLSASMSFAPTAIVVGRVSRLSYELRNDLTVAATGVSLSDTLPDGLVVADPPNASSSCLGGSPAATAGGSDVSYSGGAVRAGTTCTIAVDVTSAVAGSYLNRMGTTETERVRSSLGTSTPVEATLTVTESEPPLSVSMSFSPAVIGVGRVSRLTYELRNVAAVEATSGVLRDMLPTGVEVADPPNASSSCGGSLRAAPGGNMVEWGANRRPAGTSCRISVDVTAAAAGRYPNSTERVTSSLGDSAAAEATLTVVDAPGFAKVFSPATVDPGGVSTLTFTIDNSANVVDVGSLVFDDDFPIGLFVDTEPNVNNGCGGTLTAAAGTRTISLRGGAIAAGQTCTLSVEVQPNRPGALENVSGALSSDLPATTPGASATLTVRQPPLSVSMSFSPAVIAVGRVSRLRYVVRNDATVEARSGVLRDTLPTGVELSNPPNASSNCAGLLTAAPGGNMVEWGGNRRAAGSSCTLAVDVTATVAGLHRNSIETVLSSLGAIAAEATLTAVPVVAPGFTKAFSPATVDPGVSSTLTFTIDNSANVIDVGSLAFTDDFPIDLFVDFAPNVNNGCGGTLTAAMGTRTVSLRGGTVAAGQTCTISVDVESTRIGRRTSRSSELTSELPVTTPGASATLTVNAAPLSVSMAFSPTAVRVGGVSRLSYELRNVAAISSTGVSLSDTLPDGLVVADPPNASSSCLGGSPAATAGGSDVSYSGGAVRAGTTCTIAVDVTSAVAGSYLNRMGTTETERVRSSLGTSTPVEATLTVTESEPPLSVSMSFSPARITAGGVSRLTYELGNVAAVTATGVSLSDTLPPGVVVAAVPNRSVTNCFGGGGVLSATPGGDRIRWNANSHRTGETCTFAVDVTATAAGRYPNSTESVTSSLGASTPADAALTVVAAPGFAKAFSPATALKGGTSRLTFTIDNSANVIDVGGLAFTDPFPDGLFVGPNVNNGCGGTLVAGRGNVAVSLSGGAVAAGQTCTISLDVMVLRAGVLENVSGALTSELPVSTPGASATLRATEPPLSVSMAFEPAAIDQGGVSSLSYELRNVAAIAATSVSLSDRLPADVVLADPPNARTTCTGGTLAASGGDVSYSGGSLAVGSNCAITVDVTSAAVGSHPNDTENVTSSLGTSTAASATLMVNAAAAPGFAKAFSPATVAPGGVSRLTFTIDNAANLIDVGSLAFDDDFPDGLAVADPPNGSTTCGGTFAPAASATALTFLGGRVGAGQSCTLSVDVRALRAGALTGISGDLTSDLPVATPGASATLTVSEAALVVVLSFSPSTIDQGGVSMLTYRLLNQAPVAATSVALSDTLPDGVVLADPPNAETTCAGGTLTAAAGGSEVSYSDGALSRGRACTITVDVTSAAVGSHPNDAVSATSSLGTTGRPTPATLTVDPAAAPGFARVFSPDTIPQGGETEIVFTVDNTANTIGMTGMAFDDSLPPGVSVADTPGAVNGCGGTFNPVAGATTLSFADGVLAAGATCELRVTVRATGAGTLTGPEVVLTSSIATASAAEATLTVAPPEAPGFARVFSPDSIDQGGETEIVFTVDNTANAIAMTGMAFDDSLPPGVSVADTPGAVNGCGGTFSPVAGATTLGFADGVLAAGARCELRVTVRAIEAGTLTGPAVALTSNIATARAAEATLTVDAAETPGFARVFSPDSIDQGEETEIVFTVDNTANAIAMMEMAFDDSLPPGVSVADTPGAVNGCGGAFSPVAGATTLGFHGRRARRGRHVRAPGDGARPRGGNADRPGRRPDVEHRHGECRRGHADGRSAGGAGLRQGLFPGHGRSGRGIDADLHDRQYGQRHRGGLSRLQR